MKKKKNNKKNKSIAPKKEKTLQKILQATLTILNFITVLVQLALSLLR